MNESDLRLIARIKVIGNSPALRDVAHNGYRNPLIRSGQPKAQLSALLLRINRYYMLTWIGQGSVGHYDTGEGQLHVFNLTCGIDHH